MRTGPNLLHRSCGTCALLAVALLVPVDGTAQQSKSAADLISFLTYQSGRSMDPAEATGTFTCGLMSRPLKENGAIAESLVKLGRSAIPDLEGAITSVEKQGNKSRFYPNVAWLFYAFAKIEGPSGAPRLTAMMSNQKLAPLHEALRNAISLSLGLTSFVDISMVPVKRLCENKQPRDALDSVIVEWEQRKAAGLAANLGPSARAAFMESADHGPQENRTGHHGVTAVGYRFDKPGRWSSPPITLTHESWEGEPEDISKIPTTLEIDAAFTNGSGDACGRYRVTFIHSPGQLDYKVDNTDIDGLLRVISSCVSAN